MHLIIHYSTAYYIIFNYSVALYNITYLITL